MDFRIEKDTLGEVKVPIDKLWGAQTQRSFNNFKIGHQTMPKEIIYGLALVKKAAAAANCEAGVLAEEKRKLIADCCDEILAGKLDEHFPGLKNRYVNEFGNDYFIPSPDNDRLMDIFYRKTSQNNILNNSQEIFEYLHDFPQKSYQSKLI